MARRKKFGNERISLDGETRIRDVSSPGGTLLDTQTLAGTPLKQHEAWQYTVPPSATAGEAAKLRKANGQSCRDARKKGNTQENQKKHLVNHSLSAQCVRVLAKVGRFLAQSDVRRKKHFLM